METICGLLLSWQRKNWTDINNITNEELVRLSQKVGVSHISLMEQTDDDIVVNRSSDPREIGLSTKSMTYWYQAFKQLFEKQQVTIPQGQKLEHFWSDGIPNIRHPVLRILISGVTTMMERETT